MGPPSPVYQFHCFQSACIRSLQLFTGASLSFHIAAPVSGLQRKFRCPELTASCLLLSDITQKKLFRENNFIADI
jgi:hypothetical protein